MVIVPTRELVLQVTTEFQQLIKKTNLTVVGIYGDIPFRSDQQMFGESQHKLLGGHSQVDIVVSTPGRLVDHLETTVGFTLQHLQFFVVDEVSLLPPPAPFLTWNVF